jgi:hypothetical protein
MLLPMGIVLGPEHPFWGARAKVVRAGTHVNTLDAEFAEWCERYPHGLVAIPEVEEIDPATGEYIASFTFDVNPPDWGVIIGEVLHDIRSALNHLVVVVAETPTGKTQFPCALTPNDYKSSWEMIDTVPTEYVAIIESVQPCQRGDIRLAVLDPLARLVTLNNRDKHHLLLVTLLGLQDTTGAFKSVWEHPGVQSVELHFSPMEDEAKILDVQFRGGEEQDMDVKNNPAIGVVFDEPELPSVHRQSVLPILADILKTARGIVDDFFRVEMS